MSIRRLGPILIGAVLLTGLNSIKPLHIDDAALELSSRQYLQNPLDPYGFALFWWDHPEPANDVLMPPVLPAYIGLVRRLVGDNIVIWKWSLLPWSLVLAGALDCLLYRFVGGGRGALLFLLLLSPGFVPNYNLWLDLPALALGLSALFLFFRAADTRSLFAAVLAGLIAGVAMQTKYTAFTVPPAMVLYACCAGRWREGLTAAAIAVSVFLSWEAFTWSLYGAPHFLRALRRNETDTILTKLKLFPFLLSYLGGLYPAVLALGLAGLGAGWRSLSAFLVVTVLGYITVALFDIQVISYLEIEPITMQFAEIFCLLLGAGLMIVTFLAAGMLLLRLGQRPQPRARNVQAIFLVLWLLLEIGAYPVLTPFPAARRVLGVGLVATLLLARFAVPRLRIHRRRSLLPWISAAGVTLALGYWWLDLQAAQAYRTMAEDAATWVNAQGHGKGWFVGHWGFQYYAERAGLAPLIPEYQPPPGGRITLPPPSRVHEGDWIIVPDPSIAQQSFKIDPEQVEMWVERETSASLPLRVTPCYYAGRSPVEHNDAPLIRVTICRVKMDCVPR